MQTNTSCKTKCNPILLGTEFLIENEECFVQPIKSYSFLNSHSLFAGGGMIKYVSHSIYTSNYSNELDTKYNDFVKENDLTDNQKYILEEVLITLTEVIKKTSQLNLLNQIKIKSALDDEIIIYRKNTKGVFSIVIDDEGDIMLSFSPFKNIKVKGSRKFIDFEKFNSFKASKMLLS